MIRKPNPILNDEELKLLNSRPEECLRRAVRRGAFSLDQVTQRLPPHVAAAVRSIATGERLATLAVEPEPEKDGADQSPTHSRAASWSYEQARNTLSGHPQLARMLHEKTLTPDEALEAAQAIDRTLGRYMTGTRYAAP